MSKNLYSLSVGANGRPLAENLQNSAERFNELVHTGWQSSLPAAPDGGFLPGEADVDRLQYANSNYADLPPAEQQVCAATSNYLTAFICREVVQKYDRSIYDVIEEGREAAFRGWVHGRHGNPYGMYDMGDPVQEKQHDEVVSRMRRYDEVDPDLQQVDETIFMLGMQAFRRPKLFPWVADRNIRRSDLKRDGIEEVALRAEAAIRRVIRIRGHATPLQAAMLQGKHATL